jgi:hypothetical protein
LDGLRAQPHDAVSVFAGKAKSNVATETSHRPPGLVVMKALKSGPHFRGEIPTPQSDTFTSSEPTALAPTVVAALEIRFSKARSPYPFFTITWRTTV